MPRTYHKIIPICHPDRKHQAKGYCRTCYSHIWRKGHTEKVIVYRNTTNRTWHSKNRAKVNAANRVRYHKLTPYQKRLLSIKKTYGLSQTQYEDMLRKQNNSCAICKIAKLDLVIDHEHAKGTKVGVRGILCNECNIFLGILEKNLSLIQSAKDYLGNASLSCL
jgi:hypothetical protein